MKEFDDYASMGWREVAKRERRRRYRNFIKVEMDRIAFFQKALEKLKRPYHKKDLAYIAWVAEKIVRAKQKIIKLTKEYFKEE